jgi:hypothetical protein
VISYFDNSKIYFQQFSSMDNQQVKVANGKFEAQRVIVALPSERLGLVKAILIAQAHVDKESVAHRLYPSSKLLEERVNEIVDHLGLPRSAELNLNHVHKIEKLLREYSVIVYTGCSRNQTPIYFNRVNEKKKFIYILHQNDQFNVILDIKSFLNVQFFCDYCQQKFKRVGEHECSQNDLAYLFSTIL